MIPPLIIGEIALVAQEAVYRAARRNTLADNRKRAAGAAFDTAPAAIAVASIQQVLAIRTQLVHGGAEVETGAAVNAFIGGEGERWQGALAFRIVAPQAPEGTALEKERTANARAIMDGKGLHPKDRAGHILTQSLCPPHHILRII